MKIALLEASHWHAPLYLDAMAAPGLEVVAVSDAEGPRGRSIAERFGCRSYDSYESLLQQEAVDFAFAFGRHSEMPRIGESLVQRRIPFAIEKPCGISALDVARLKQLADAAGVYVAVPFIFRLSDLLHAVREAEDGLPPDFQHLSFRFIAGPLSRYETAGVPWMLDPAVAGGGCTINLATHFVDLFRVLTGKEVASVAAVMTQRLHGGQVEDHSVMTLRTADDVIGVIETGYGFPSTTDEQREFSFTMGSRRNYMRSLADGIAIRSRSDTAAGTARRPLRLETDVYYPEFVRRVLGEVAAGKPPVASLADAHAMMKVMDAAYQSARTGGVPVPVRPDR
jgi:predicted dehydrogenase